MASEGLLGRLHELSGSHVGGSIAALGLLQNGNDAEVTEYLEKLLQRIGTDQASI